MHGDCEPRAVFWARSGPRSARRVAGFCPFVDFKMIGNRVKDAIAGRTALIIGDGSGIGAAGGRKFSEMSVGLAHGKVNRWT